MIATEPVENGKQDATRKIEHRSRIENRILNVAEFERREIALTSLPRAIFVELTQNCNLKCAHCKDGKPSGYRSNLDMDIALYRQVAEELFPTAELVDLRGWGESTILKSFPMFVDIAASYNVQIRLVTNGMIPDPKIWDQLMACRAMVVISCDSADPDLFQLIRGGGNLQLLIKTVKTIVKYKNKYKVPDENVYFTGVVSRRNIDNLPALLQLAHRLGLTKVILFPILIESSNPMHLSNCITAARQGLDAAHRTADSLKMTLQLGAAFDESLRRSGDVKKICINPWTYTLIDYSGRVGYCDHLIGQHRFALGSLYKKGFAEIWNNRAFRKLRKAHTYGHLPFRFRKCRWCYKLRYVDIENSIHPQYARELVSNRTRSRLY